MLVLLFHTTLVVHFLLHMRITYHVVIMAQVMPVAFSQTGEYFAYSSPDGTLKLWETVTGTLKQEYTPSSHLSATCTCLAWGPSRKSNVSCPRPLRCSPSKSKWSMLVWLTVWGLSVNSLVHGSYMLCFTK